MPEKPTMPPARIFKESELLEEDKEQLDFRAKPILIDGAEAVRAETKIEDKWRLPDADGNIRLQICNRGQIDEMYDFLQNYLATRGIILTPPGSYYFESAIRAHRLVCGIGIPKGLEGVTIDLKKQGRIFKRTAFSINGDIPEDIAAHLKSAIFDYAFPNYGIK